MATTVLSTDWLAAFWNLPQVAVNVVIFLNLLGALALGMLVGYERSYHGRAAGMRTYGIVCMASAALTVFAGYPSFWYGGHTATAPAADPTRLVQGIVTGIGFLGAGVILKEGLNIRGLTTAASIWAASAIGVLVGVGFYAAAMLLTALSSALMMWGPRLERLLPHRKAIVLTLRFKPDLLPSEEAMQRLVTSYGYELASDSMAIASNSLTVEWRCVATAIGKDGALPVAELARELRGITGLECFELGQVRN